jgi:hypothetical protein
MRFGLDSRQDKDFLIVTSELVPKPTQLPGPLPSIIKQQRFEIHSH